MAKKSTAKSKAKDNNQPKNWNVRGVTEENKTRAKMAAKKSGKTLGDWLNDTIARASSDELSHSNVPAVPMEDLMAKYFEKNDERMAKQDERMAELKEMLENQKPKKRKWWW